MSTVLENCYFLICSFIVSIPNIQGLLSLNEIFSLRLAVAALLLKSFNQGTKPKLSLNAGNKVFLVFVLSWRKWWRLRRTRMPKSFWNASILRLKKELWVRLLIVSLYVRYLSRDVNISHLIHFYSFIHCILMMISVVFGFSWHLFCYL